VDRHFLISRYRNFYRVGILEFYRDGVNVTMVYQWIRKLESFAIGIVEFIAFYVYVLQHTILTIAIHEYIIFISHIPC
jgi:hypothetical protein